MAQLSKTNTLIEITQQAKLGLIHPSLIRQNQLLTQIKYIRNTLPSESNLS